MSSFNIKIDATKLFYRRFKIPGVTAEPPAEPPDSRVVQTITVAAGTYQLMFTKHPVVTFDVKPSGTVDYDKGLDGFVKGRGSTTLTVEGVPVTLDARYVAMNGGLGVLLGTALDHEDWIVHETIRLIPASYTVQQGAAMTSSFAFTLRADGRVEYDPKFEYSTGGFLEGQDTSTLVFRGYPILLDATQVGEKVNFLNIKGLLAAGNGVLFVNLLPMNVAFRIVVKGSGVTEMTPLSVQVDTSGAITLIPEEHFSRDTFNGLARIKIKKL